MWYGKKRYAAVFIVCAFLFWLASVAVAQTGAFHGGHHGYTSEDVGANNNDDFEGEYYESHHGSNHAYHNGFEGYHGHGSSHYMGYGNGYQGYRHHYMGRGNYGQGSGC